MIAFSLALAGLLVACGGDDDEGGASPGASGFEPSAGSDIPAATVNFTMWPYLSELVGVIAIENGYFEEVGIDIQPSEGATMTIEQTTGRLINEQVEVAPTFVPLQIQSHAQVPEPKAFAFHVAYVANTVLASPEVGAKTIDEFLDEGQSFEEAVVSTVEQMRGQRVALSDTGVNRGFFDAVIELGGLTTDDFELEQVSDARIVQLAKGGNTDFAAPGGTSQMVELMNLDFPRIVTTENLLDGLPQGDPRAVGGVGHAGVQATEEWIDANKETALRFSSVYWRLIDEIESNPDETLATALPALESSAGVEISLEDAKTIFAELYIPLNFESQADHLVNEEFPLYYESVYESQLEAAEEGGIIPPGRNVTPDDLVVARELYEIMVDLKAQYDDLKADEAPSGPLADQAEEQYAHHNYLDAYRLLQAAAEE